MNLEQALSGRLPIVYSDRFLDHDTGLGHPERPERLSATVTHLRSQPWSTALDWYLPTDLATRSPLPWIETCHSLHYIDSVQHLAERGGGSLDPDTPCSAASYEVALLAVNAWLDGIDRLLTRQSQAAFALTRPPRTSRAGHPWHGFLSVWQCRDRSPLCSRSRTDESCDRRLGCPSRQRDASLSRTAAGDRLRLPPPKSGLPWHGLRLGDWLL